MVEPGHETQNRIDKRQAALKHLRCGLLKGWMRFTHNNVAAILYKYRHVWFGTLVALDEESEPLMTKPDDEVDEHLYVSLSKVIETEELYYQVDTQIHHLHKYGMYASDDLDVEGDNWYERMINRGQRATEKMNKLITHNNEQFDVLIQQLQEAWPLLYIYKFAVGCINPYQPLSYGDVSCGLLQETKDNHLVTVERIKEEEDTPEKDKEEDKEEEQNITLRTLIKHHLRFELLEEVLYFLRKCRFMSMDHYTKFNKMFKRLHRKMHLDKVESTLASLEILHEFLPDELVTFNIFPFMNEYIYE